MKSGSREATKTMPCSSITLALSDAKRMLEAGEAKAASIGIAYNIAVVDAGGALVAFTRQDGALYGYADRDGKNGPPPRALLELKVSPRSKDVWTGRALMWVA
jgi:hypothetical protein